MSLVKTTNPNLVKDTNSGALLNIRLQEFETYKSSRQRFIDILDTKKYMDKLEFELVELKSLIASKLKE